MNWDFQPATYAVVALEPGEKCPKYLVRVLNGPGEPNSTRTDYFVTCILVDHDVRNILAMEGDVARNIFENILKIYKCSKADISFGAFVNFQNVLKPSRRSKLR